MLKKKRVITGWIVSYMMILFVPLITIWVNYNYNAQVIQQEIMQAHELILGNLKSNIDILLENEKTIFSYCYENDTLKEFVTSEKNADFYWNVYSMKEDISSYTIGENNKIECWIYLKQQDYLITSNTGTGDSASLYMSQQGSGSEMLTYGVWRAFLEDKYVNQYIFEEEVSRQKINKNLTFANTYRYYGDEIANIFIKIPISVIQEYLTDLPNGSLFAIALDKGNGANEFCIFNGDGEVEIPANLDINTLFVSESIEFDDYMGIMKKSDTKCMNYALLVPKEVFWKDARYVRNIHIISLFATIFVGFVLVVFLVKKNYTPLSELLRNIKIENKEINEFKLIETAYNRIHMQNNAMRKMAQKHEDKLIGNYLLSLLKGRIIKLKDYEQQIGFDLPLNEVIYAFVGLSVPVINRNLEQDELHFFIVDNILSELMSEYRFYRIDDGRFMYYLFYLPETQEKLWKEKCENKMEYMCEILDEKFNLPVTVVISTTERNFDQIKYVYQSMMDAFEYKRIIGGEGIVWIDEVQQYDENRQLHICHELLIQAFEKANIKEVKRISEELFSSMGNMSFIVMKLRVLEIFLLINDSYSNFIIDSVKRMQLLSWLEILIRTETIEDLKRKYEEMLEFACTRIGSQWESENKKIVKAVKKNIEEKYMDCNLSIATIAEDMERNSQYISKVFRAETGDGITDYISRMRVYKAQEILLSKKISIEEVGSIVGFASVRTFRRCFTKYIGCTPSAYIEKNTGIIGENR